MNMIANCRAALLIAFLSFTGTLHAAQSPWKITKLNLAPHNEISHTLTVTVTSRGRSKPVEISANVRLTKVDDDFVSGDKLVVMGEAGRAQAVVIFELPTGREVDWFFCYYPQRVSDEWILSVEFYPSMGAETPTDVVLLYDLTKSPTENRLRKVPNEVIPAGKGSNPIQVGTPIYPEMNASGRSYLNVLRDGSMAELVFAHTFVLLPGKLVVFVGGQGVEKGIDRVRSRNYLVVVDLSRGVANASHTMVDIPKDQFKRPGEFPQFVHVDRAEAIPGTNKVRLYVPQMDYGVGSILVDIPNNAGGTTTRMDFDTIPCSDSVSR